MYDVKIDGNAINLSDGLDALASGIVFTILIGCLIYTSYLGKTNLSILCIIIEIIQDLNLNFYQLSDLIISNSHNHIFVLSVYIMGMRIYLVPNHLIYLLHLLLDYNQNQSFLR